MRVASFLSLTYVLAGTAYGANCQVETAVGASHVVCRAASNAGKPLSLTFPDAAVTTVADTATLCGGQAATVTDVKLWMPEMGHGSGPVSLAMGSDGCSTISDIDFLMAGTWQVKVRFSDSDQGVIDVVVAD